ncbi:MAG TPA: MraY family glycosyltransferase [bacterium]|nr:MraY family glycosyltransferase [bacterium]
MKINQRTLNITRQFISQFKDKNITLSTLSILIISFQFIYIFFRSKYLNAEIPLWYTRLWGDNWLAPKSAIYIIPAVSFLVFVFGLLLILFNRYYIKYFRGLIWSAVLFCISFLTYSLITIVHNSSIFFKPAVNPNLIPLFIPLILSFLLTFLIVPYFIEFAQNKRIVTSPQMHQHPGMVLEAPSARGGGVVYGLIFLLLSILFVGIPQHFTGIFLSILMIIGLSIIDDYQNTHPLSPLKVFENPFLRLFLLLLSVIPTVLSGILIIEVTNPLGDLLILTSIHEALPAVITILWIVWVMNVLSWSNGIDGQYSGIIGIASLAVMFLALRFKPLESIHTQIAILAAISAGSAFGLSKYNWHPSKIMWGFGAMTAGLLIAALSISVKGKIITSVLIILIPFMDAVVTVIRRLIQGKNPLSGDRGHLHHLLLDRGWNVQKIARFYWITTAVFALIGLLTPERYAIQTAMIIVGLVAFIIVLMNVRSGLNRKEKLKFER